MILGAGPDSVLHPFTLLSRSLYPAQNGRYRKISIRGKVVEITEEGADEHLDKLAQRYLEKDKYPPSMRFEGEVRCIYKIEPKHVTTWNPFG